MLDDIENVSSVEMSSKYVIGVTESKLFINSTGLKG
jgi:hypothetical protein